MLDAAAVEIHRSPVGDPGGIERPFVVVGVAEPVVVPRRIDERIHRVGFAPGRAAAARAAHVHEVGNVRQRRIAAAGELHDRGQHHRQILVRNGHGPARAAVDHRDRRAPVTLARHAPVFEPVLHASLPDSARLRIVGHPPVGVARRKPRVRTGVHDRPVGVEGLGQAVARQATVLGLDNDPDGQVVPAGELEVALIVRRHAHHRTGAVLDQHEVRNPHGHRLSGEGIDHLPSRVEAFLLHLADEARRPVLAAEPRRLGTESHRVRRFVRETVDQRMLGGEQHERRAVDRVDARREDLDVVRHRPAGRLRRGGRRPTGRRQGEPDAGALRATDPVALHRQHLVRPGVEPGDGVEQLVRVGGDAQEPLLQLSRGHRRSAAPAAPVDHLLVGQHGPAALAPVDGGPLPKRQAALVHAGEQPLVPAVVVRQARGQLALPGVADAEPLELAFHVRDVVEGPPLRVHVVLDGGVLGRQAERVPAEWMEDVVAAHPHRARHDVADHVVADVAHVRVPGRVREHLEAVELRPGLVLGDFEGPRLGPVALPLRLESSAGRSP